MGLSLFYFVVVYKQLGLVPVQASWYLIQQMKIRAYLHPKWCSCVKSSESYLLKDLSALAVSGTSDQKF